MESNDPSCGKGREQGLALSEGEIEAAVGSSSSRWTPDRLDGHFEERSIVLDRPEPLLDGLTVFLRDINPGMTEAWTRVFRDESYPEGIAEVDEPLRALLAKSIHISTGDIFYEKRRAIHADAIVSPANSFGFMDGGIDYIYCRRFGWQLMERLQDDIRGDEWCGEIPVGCAHVIEAKDPRGTIKYMVCAPTMRVPATVRKTPNAFLAFRATLLAIRNHNKAVNEGSKQGTVIKSVLCPGLGTAVGLMPYETCAFQMLRAYQNVVLGRRFPHASLMGVKIEDENLRKDRLSAEERDAIDRFERATAKTKKGNSADGQSGDAAGGEGANRDAKAEYASGIAQRMEKEQVLQEMEILQMRLKEIESREKAKAEDPEKNN